MKAKAIPTILIIIEVIFFLVGCTPKDQEYIQTQVAKEGRTAVAEGEKLAATQGVKLKETALAAASTEAAKMKETALASAPTEVAKMKETASALATQLVGGLRYSREFKNIAGTDKYLIGAYFYPWWGPADNHWKDGYSGQPSLGIYDSSDMKIINRQIDWATGHGIDFFAVSWWGPNSKENSVLLNSFLKSDLSSDIHYAILYESTGLLTQSNGAINLDNPADSQKLMDDFSYIQSTYWKDKRYLKIRGKPVVFLYLTRIMQGDINRTFADLRTLLKKNGNDVYLVADEVYWQKYQPLDANRLKAFDAVTAYNMYTSVPDIAVNFTANVKNEFSDWRAKARNVGVAFVPDVIPGFDDTFVRPQENHPVISSSKELFASQLDMALNMLDPSINMILITSWNEWHEGTSIEPSQEFGFDFLDILQKKLGH